MSVVILESTGAISVHTLYHAKHLNLFVRKEEGIQQSTDTNWTFSGETGLEGVLRMHLGLSSPEWALGFWNQPQVEPSEL